jgi:hypothetical protein
LFPGADAAAAVSYFLLLIHHRLKIFLFKGTLNENQYTYIEFTRAFSLSPTLSLSLEKNRNEIVTLRRAKGG